MRPAALALAVSGLAAGACSPAASPACPGEPVASFRFRGTLAAAGAIDPALDPDPTLLDCPPTPPDMVYPDTVEFDAKLAQDPGTSAAALCRPNGVAYVGVRTGASSYSVSAEASPAVLCSSACEADLRVTIAGTVAVDASGAPTGFEGVLVEVLTAARGACDTCLPLVPGAVPAEHACAGRYALTGTPL